MNKFIVIILISLSSLCQAQDFYVKDSANIITVNIPHKFKSYTYNQFSLTDTSLIVSSEREKFDLIIRNPETNKNVVLLFPPTKPKIRGKEIYQMESGEAAVFVVSADQTYFLSSNQNISFDFVVDEFGDLVDFKELPPGENFYLSPGRTYGFKFLPDTIGSMEINLSLYKDGTCIETKKIPVYVSPKDIELKTETIIEGLGFEKQIHYKIISSFPLASTLNLSLRLKIETNGFSENLVIENICFKKNTRECSGMVKKVFKGRLPRSMTISKTQLEIIQKENNANYHINITNL